MSAEIGFVREVAEHHRQKILDRNGKVNDPLFSSGSAWAVHALDRVIRACNGESDPEALGLAVGPSRQAIQEALFITEVRQDRKCVRCGERAHLRTRGSQGRKHKMCKECITWAIDAGHIEKVERKFYNRDELLDEWIILCREGHTRQQAGERLKMNPRSFCRALERARKDGDPRAVLDWRQREWRAARGK